MAARIAWVLNLDADLELATGVGYMPTRTVRAALATHVARLAHSLLRPLDVLVDDASELGCAVGMGGRAFCPTPRALAVLRRVGADPAPHPSVDVLRRVNGRAFAASLGTTLEGAEFVVDIERAMAILASPPPLSSAWRIKRSFGMSGRGQRVVHGSATAADVAFLRASMRDGVQIEPNVAVEREYAMHGMLEPSGVLRVGRLVMQRCDRHGAWLSTEPCSDVEPAQHLRQEVQRVGRALSQAGYFGPFGIDAFTFRDRDGKLHFQPRSEINARYSMGFACGFPGSGAAE